VSQIYVQVIAPRFRLNALLNENSEHMKALCCSKELVGWVRPTAYQWNACFSVFAN